VQSLFRDAELQELMFVQPALKLIEAGVLEGEFRLDAEFAGIRLVENFQIRIDVNVPPAGRIPILQEIAGKTVAIAAKHNAKVADLHRNAADGTACVCVKQEEPRRLPPGSGFREYIKELVIPYLFGVAYFDKFGKWPWPECSHGVAGILEFFAELPVDEIPNYCEETIGFLRNYPETWPLCLDRIRNPSGKKPCICGSGTPFESCHPRACKGLRRAHRFLKDALTTAKNS
jgi:hypothetical protein